MEKNEFRIIHRSMTEAAADRIITDAGSEEALYDLADFFKIFSDSTRIRILMALMDRELCVLDIANELTMTSSAISHQLRILKGARLVKNRREGKEIFYSLDDDHIKHILAQGLEHVKER